MKTFRRLLSLVMTLALVFSFFPAAPKAFAADQAVTVQATVDGEYIRLDIITNEFLEYAAGFVFVVTPPEGLSFVDRKTVAYDGFKLQKNAAKNKVQMDYSPEDSSDEEYGIDIPAGSVILTLY